MKKRASKKGTRSLVPSTLTKGRTFEGVKMYPTTSFTDHEAALSYAERYRSAGIRCRIVREGANAKHPETRWIMYKSLRPSIRKARIATKTNTRTLRRDSKGRYVKA